MARPTPEEARRARDQKLREVTARLERAVADLVSSDDWMRAIAFSARFRARSFANTLLIFVQHQEAYDQGRVSEPTPSYVAGFQAWKRLDRQVMKGQAGYVIRAPVTARFASLTPHVVESWRKLGRSESPHTGETVRLALIDTRPAYVWDVSQTSGPGVIPVRPMPRLLNGQAPPGLWAGLADQVASEGFSLLRAASSRELGGANGVTDYTERTVHVRADMDDAAQVKTLAHELGHVLMHSDAIRGPEFHRGIGEVEAESVAAMICASYGLDTSAYSIPYVASWSTAVDGQTPFDVVRLTGERVRTVSLRIIEGLPEPPVDDGRPPGDDHRPPGGDPILQSVDDRSAEQRTPLMPSVGVRSDRAHLPARGVSL